jgi:hypothetical protein
MRINKSQGQSLKMVGLYLLKHVFTHGQLYVAFSRVTRRDVLRVMVNDEDNKEDDVVNNMYSLQRNFLKVSQNDIFFLYCYFNLMILQTFQKTIITKETHHLLTTTFN